MATAAMAGQGFMGMGDAQTREARNRELFALQQRARRGPTPEVFFAKHIDNSRIVKADDPERRREMRIFSATMSVLFLLVMVYVWQHFLAIEVGYQIEVQKADVQQITEQNRQLRLSEAQLTSPDRIDHMAKLLGLDANQPGQIVHPDGSGSGAPVMASTAAPALPNE